MRQTCHQNDFRNRPVVIQRMALPRQTVAPVGIATVPQDACQSPHVDMGSQRRSQLHVRMLLRTLVMRGVHAALRKIPQNRSTFAAVVPMGVPTTAIGGATDEKV
tara:strand:+ start:210 stop:524 length:315 start_codon:yes stop_codon:yes gene_type:complete